MVYSTTSGLFVNLTALEASVTEIGLLLVDPFGPRATLVAARLVGLTVLSEAKGHRSGRLCDRAVKRCQATI